jgi:hypothetical protein
MQTRRRDRTPTPRARRPWVAWCWILSLVLLAACGPEEVGDPPTPELDDDDSGHDGSGDDDDCAPPDDDDVEPPTPHRCCPEGVWRELAPGDGRPESEDWCTLAPSPTSGLQEPPPAFAARLHEGIEIQPELVQCPVEFSQWVPFVDRTTVGWPGTANDHAFDEDGVVMIDLGGIYPDVGFEYSAMSIALYLVRLFGDTIIYGSDEETMDALRAQADWLADNGLLRTWDGVPFLIWENAFPNIWFDYEEHWVSGYAQGLIVPALIGAYCATGEERYLETAGLAAAAFAMPVRRGGVATWIDPDTAWFEEASDSEGASSRIINGHVAAVAGLWSSAAWTGNEDLAALVEAGIQATRAGMHLHNPGFVSTYSQFANVDVFPLVAHSEGYNRFHTSQFIWLFDVTGDIGFLAEAFRTARFDDPFFEIAVSGTEDGNPEFAYHRRMIDHWADRPGGWVEWTLTEQQPVGGVTLWSDLPERSPDLYRVEVQSGTGEPEVFERPWPEGCRDTFLPIPDVSGDRVRVTLESGGDLVGLRAVGIHRSGRHPAAVAHWLYHSESNRPGFMYSEQGWRYSNSSWLILDLDGAFHGLQLEFSHWTSPAEPTFLVGDALDGLTPAAPTVIRDGSTLLVRVEEVEARYLWLNLPGDNLTAERRLWVHRYP